MIRSKKLDRWLVTVRKDQKRNFTLKRCEMNDRKTMLLVSAWYGHQDSGNYIYKFGQQWWPTWQVWKFGKCDKCQWQVAGSEETITHGDSNDLDEINEIRLDEIDKMLRYFKISFRQFCNPISHHFLSLQKLFAKLLQTIQNSIWMKPEVHKRSRKSTKMIINSMDSDMANGVMHKYL